MSRIVVKAPPEKGGDVMLTAPQVQALLGVSYRTLLRMRQRGLGPTAYRFDRHWKYRARDVGRWLIDRAGDGRAVG